MAMSPERIAERKASRDYDNRMSRLITVAHMVHIGVDKGGDLFTIDIDCCTIQARNVDRLNEMLERLGYRPIRITKNMLNANAPRFAIDANTPAYCDPGCESYHSM